MYRGFNVELNLKRDSVFNNLKLKGEDLYESYSNTVRAKLDSFISSGSTMDGTAIQKTWFPEIECDIFISHSHLNEDTAFALAGWLWENFELKAFIDSSIWGYADDLLWELDKKFCSNGKDSFNYRQRNHSTSHVHMMLSTAISMMIHKTECLFFLNTPQSIKSYGSIDKTQSPWLYLEIATSQFVEKTKPMRPVLESKRHLYSEGSENLEKGFKAEYEITAALKGLTKLEFEDLILWEKYPITMQHPLDDLYDLYPPKKK